MRSTALQLLATILVIFLVTFIAAATAEAADSEITIGSDGKIKATNLKIIQKAGTNLFTRAEWSKTHLRLVVLTGKAEVTKKYGEPLALEEIREGDYINVEGEIAGTDSLVINASKIQDVSKEKAGKTLSGTIESLSSDSRSFQLANVLFGRMKVTLSDSATIKKGVRTISVSELTAGDRATSVSGVYDYATNELTATSLEIHQDKTIFKPKNFQGTLKDISASSLPASLTVLVGSQEYTVYLSAKTSVLSRSKKPASLARFVAGDTVRFFGSIREGNLAEIDAEVIRDLNF